MPIPTYDQIMLPLLQLVRDQQQRHVRDVEQPLAKHFNLTTDEQQQLLGSGKKTVFYDRIGWAKTYLTQAGLLAKTGRGLFTITDAGLALLAQNPPAIDRPLLLQYESFRQFQSRSRTEGDAAPTSLHAPTAPLPAEDERTPDERIADAYNVLRTLLEDDLRQRLHALDPAFFEQVVLDVLRAMGYGAATPHGGLRVGGSGDGGIDGIIYEDRLGLDVIYVQAKRWQGTVGSQMMRDFVGALVGKQATKGIFITTSTFTRDANDYIERVPQKVILIDGERLAALMFDYNVGVTAAQSFVVKKIDLNYFNDEDER